jgi:hypothetical protein
VSSNASGAVIVGSRPPRKAKYRRYPLSRPVWSGTLRLLQRITHIRPSNLLEYRLGYSVRDVVADRSRVVKDQMEAFASSVQKAGSYQAREEATRAFHAVMEAMNDRVPPDVLIKLSESLPVREAARLRRAAAQRLRKDEDKG